MSFRPLSGISIIYRFYILRWSSVNGFRPLSGISIIYLVGWQDFIDNIDEGFRPLSGISIIYYTKRKQYVSFDEFSSPLGDIYYLSEYGR